MLPAARRLLPALSVLALLAACRDRASDGSTATAAATTDSAFVRDLAMAQRQAPPQTVFNDAPLGGTMNAAPAATPSPELPRARTPRPTPAPTRRTPPAPVARTPRPTAPEPAPVAEEPAPAPAANASAGVIGAGTRVGMTTNDRVCTLALAGDKFTATVSSATMGSNGASIPAGATVVLEVTSVERADPVESSRIHFHVRAIDVNGEPHPAEGDVTVVGTMQPVRVSGGSDRK